MTSAINIRIFPQNEVGIDVSRPYSRLSVITRGVQTRESKCRKKYKGRSTRAWFKRKLSHMSHTFPGLRSRIVMDSDTKTLQGYLGEETGVILMFECRPDVKVTFRKKRVSNLGGAEGKVCCEREGVGGIRGPACWQMRWTHHENWVQGELHKIHDWMNNIQMDKRTTHLFLTNWMSVHPFTASFYRRLTQFHVEGGRRQVQSK